MAKTIKEVDCVWLYFPPREVFIDPDYVFNDFQSVQKFKLKDWEIILGENGGMFFKNFNKYDEPLYPGVPCPMILRELGLIKRIVITRLKSLRNPLMWICLPRFKQEVLSLNRVSFWRYFLKPFYYCKSVRELHRVWHKMFPKEYHLVHLACSFFEWDSYYRWVMQAFFGNLKYSPDLKKNLRYAIISELESIIRDNDNERIKGYWKLLKTAFQVIWIVPKFRRLIRQFFDEVNLEEIEMTQADVYFQFK